MTTITENYLHEVLSNFDYSEKMINGKTAYEFPCPFCGYRESKERKQKKKVAILIPHPESFTYTFYCHRKNTQSCSAACLFADFLRKYDERLFNKYQMERYKSGTTGKGHNLANPKFHTNKPKFE